MVLIGDHGFADRLKRLDLVYFQGERLKLGIEC
jgi:hypothetical protein